jgi:hypothetical protein
MARSLIAVVAGTGRVVVGHLWLILVAAVVPAVLACVTSVILVLSVERSKRVEAIKALPPVVAALNRTAIGRLRAMERGRKDGMPDDVNITNRP